MQLVGRHYVALRRSVVVVQAAIFKLAEQPRHLPRHLQLLAGCDHLAKTTWHYCIDLADLAQLLQRNKGQKQSFHCFVTH